MEIELYYNHSDYRYINKDVEFGEVINGTLKDATSIMSPVVLVDSDSILRYNYVYIPEFQRYYEVTEVTSVRTGLWEVSMKCDVLMSFRGDIMATQVIIDKQTEIRNANLYIDDGTYIAENKMFASVINFPAGFLENPNIILITAG